MRIPSAFNPEVTVTVTVKVDYINHRSAAEKEYGAQLYKASAQETFLINAPEIAQALTTIIINQIRREQDSQ